MVQLVLNLDSQISEVIFLNPNFTTFSSKKNVKIMILKEFLFLDVLVVSIAGKHGQTGQRPVLSTESLRDDKSDCGRFLIKNNKI